ncbi:hypothetical protein [Aliikangiella maris]|uniref:Uncharacterized protein n=1 Tax=Aliikangiella maris TaxID=3162458 RepID=A0ABV3MVD9_9GAMM
MKKYIVLILTILLSGKLLAAGQWIGPAKITKVWTQHSGNNDTFSIQLDTPVVNPDNCQYNGWYRITAADSGYKTAVSVLLSAYATGKEVRIFLSGCVAHPYFSNIEM